MTARVLPIAEWERLNGTELETVYPIVPPGMADFLVVEAGDQVVGTWGLLMLPHLEGLWVHPDHRRGTVVQRALLRGMRTVAAARGFDRAITTAVTDDVTQLITKAHGTPLPGAHFVLKVGR